MAASLPGQMPYAASPMASEWDAAVNTAQRKKKLAELLQQQALSPGDDPALHTAGAKMSVLNPIAKMAQAMASIYAGKSADTEEAAANAARDKAFDTYQADNMPRDTPAIPDIQPLAKIPELAPEGAPPAAPSPTMTAPAFGAQGMPNVGPRDNELTGSAGPMAALLAGGGPPPPASPLAPPPVPGAAGAPPLLPKPMDMGGAGAPAPLLPKLDLGAQAPAPPVLPGAEARQATPQDWLKYGSGMTKFGPAGAKLGEAIAGNALHGLKPLSPYETAEIGIKKDESATRHDDRIAALQQQAEAAQLRSEDKRYGTDAQERAAQEAIAARKELAQIAASGRGEGSKGTFSDTGRVDKDGNPISLNNKTNLYSYTGTNKPFTPSADNPVLNASDQKQFHAAQAKYKDADLLDSYSKRVGDMKGEFTTRAGIAVDASNAIGGAGMKTLSGHSAEGLKLRGEMTKHLAQVVHDLMGAAVTPKEADRNALWLPLPGDDAARLQEKMQSAAAELRARARVTTSDKVNRVAAPAAPAAGGVQAKPGDDELLRRH